MSSYNEDWLPMGDSQLAFQDLLFGFTEGDRDMLTNLDKECKSEFIFNTFR